MNSAPLVSVVIPAYNVAPFIRSAVESALQQSWKNIEVIVVDDGSTDGTSEALVQTVDPRLTVIPQSNRGSSAARNTGISAARGEYVAFLDGDDLWTRDKLERHVRFLESHPATDMAFSLSRIIDEFGRSTGRSSQRVSGTISFRRLMLENVVNNGSATVLRRSALNRVGGFDEYLRACVDYDLWLRISLLRPGNVHCIPEYLTMYRMRSGQITKDWRRMEKAWLQMVEKVRSQAPKQVSAVEASARGRLYRYLSYIAYESSEFRESASLLSEAFRSAGPALLNDRRTLVLAAALLSRSVMPRSLHKQVDVCLRGLRARCGR